MRSYYSICFLVYSPHIRSPCTPEEFIALAISSFPRLMPWEVALACNVHTDKSCDFIKGSHDRVKGSHDQGLYFAYLDRLFSNHGDQNLQGIISEVFESDHTLLSLSLTVVLEQAAKPRGHAHTKEGLPR